MATILIADDDPIVRATVSEFLTGAGHTLLEARDGVEALEQIERAAVDLLIIDMLMPNKDGLETILELRRADQAMPILAISSGGRMDVQSLLRPAVAFGATEVLAKPLRERELVAVVDELLKPPPPNGG
jgi:CheY-like chemotaxis protein